MTAVDAALDNEMVNVAVPPVLMLPGATDSDTEVFEGGVGVAVGVGVGVGMDVPPDLNAV